MATNVWIRMGHVFVVWWRALLSTGGVGILSTKAHLGLLSTPKLDEVQLSTINFHDGLMSMPMKEHCQLRKSVMEYCQPSQVRCHGQFEGRK